MLINRIVKNNKQIHNVNSVVAVRCLVCHKGRLMDASGYTQPFVLHLFCTDMSGIPDGPVLFMKCPKCGRLIGITIDRPKSLIH